MFFASFLFSIIPLTILIALVVMSSRAIWLGVIPPRRCVKEASCEKCKYPVAGLSTWTCPECGSHLLTVGIITRSMEIRRRGSYFGAVSGLFGLLLLCVIIAWSVTSITIGMSMGMGAMPSTTQLTIVTPSSGVYKSLEIKQVDDFSNTGGPYNAVLQLDVAGQLHEMHIDVFSNLSFYTKAPAGANETSGTVNVQSLTKWMQDAGADVSGAVATREIAELDAVIQAWPTNWTPPSSTALPSFFVGTTSTTVTQPTSDTRTAQYVYDTLMWFIPLLAIALFIVGAYFIIRRRRKLLRELDALVPTPTPVPSA